MSKIEEIRDELCKKSFVYAKNKDGENMTQLVGQNPNGWGKHTKSFNKGFNAAMELQLPVKFAEWKDYETRPYYLESDQIAYYLIVGIDGEYSLEELYNYWLKNIMIAMNGSGNLKKQTNMLVFTPSELEKYVKEKEDVANTEGWCAGNNKPELEKIIGDAFEAGFSRAVFETSPHNGMAPDKMEYIKSLLG